MSLSNKEPRGTLDRFPEEFEIRKYIFDTWRKVCKQFAYQEYLAPLVENVEIYRAKSGEDVGGSELTLLTNRDGSVSELALRPEMTPSVTRMVTKIFKQNSKPIRYFSIANFYRNERPQRGRNREFWQLNVDLFGSQNLNADIEILQMGMELMKAFNPPTDSRELHINSRKIIDFVLEAKLNLDENIKKEVVRTMDKRSKMSEEDFLKTLQEKGLQDIEKAQKIVGYMKCKSLDDLLILFPSIKENQAYEEMQSIIQQLTTMKYTSFLRFDPSMIRGFDYYDGMIFEVFDKHPDNNRALFGGGRYNGLATIFGSEEIPAVGFAPGDEAMKLFLESRGLLDKFKDKLRDCYYIPVLDVNLMDDYRHIARGLRLQGKNIFMGLDQQKIGKSFQYADKNKFSHIVILAEEEKYDKMYKIKDLKTAEEKYYTLV